MRLDLTSLEDGLRRFLEHGDSEVVRGLTDMLPMWFWEANDRYIPPTELT